MSASPFGGRSIAVAMPSEHGPRYGGRAPTVSPVARPLGQLRSAGFRKAPVVIHEGHFGAPTFEMHHLHQLQTRSRTSHLRWFSDGPGRRPLTSAVLRRRAQAKNMNELEALWSRNGTTLWRRSCKRPDLRRSMAWMS